MKNALLKPAIPAALMALAACVMPGCSNPAGIGIVGPDPVTLPPVIPLTIPPDTTSPDTTPPGVITNLAAHIDANSVLFTWTDPIDPDFAYVDVWFGTNDTDKSGAVVSSVARGEETYTGTGTLSEVRYYHFIAVDTGGNRSAVVNYEVIFSVPPAKADVTNLAVIIGDGSAKLTWTDPVDPAFTHVKIGWSPSPPDGGTEIISRGEGTCTLTGLGGDVAYTFTVTACYTGGSSSGLDVALTLAPDSIAPGSVTGLGAGSGDFGSVTLNWTNPNGPNDTDFQYVEITCDPFTGPPRTVQGSAGAGGSYTWNGLAGGVTYTFTVKAVDHSGNRSAGVSVTGTPYDTTPPGPVTNLAARFDNKSVVLTWTDPGDDDVEGVQIGCAEFGGKDENVYKGVQTYTWKNMDNGTAYTFTVKAFDFNSNRGATVTINLVTPLPDPLATGGTISFVKVEGSSPLEWWEIHTFTASGALTFPSGYNSVTADYLIVAGCGGAGGGSWWAGGGGGGAGGLLYKTVETLSLTDNAVTVTVGGGGGGGAKNNTGANGGKSAIGSVEVPGGGGGGGTRDTNAASPGLAGGSGGGGGCGYRVGAGGGAGSAYGHAGGASGSGTSNKNSYSGGGGGGGKGGAGKPGYSVTQMSVVGGGGAGGAAWNATTEGAAWLAAATGTNSFSGGGKGGNFGGGNTHAGGAAGPNYGDGGSGGTGQPAGAAGHSGVVVIRFQRD
jgi:hypothetical protein